MHRYLAGLVSMALGIILGFIVFPELFDTNDETPTSPPYRIVMSDIIPVAREVVIDADDLACMTTNIFFEARNQDSDEAMAAVAYTVLNRVNNPRYPDSVCDVIRQARRGSDGQPIRNRCQFSWYCDGRPDEPNMNHPAEASAWERSKRIAEAVLRGEIDNPVGNATMYHATYVSPYWRNAYNRIAQVEDHIFYGPKS